MPTKSNNTGGSGGARPSAGRKSLKSRTKPKTVIPAAENLRGWTFPKSRVLPCRSPMIFFPPSSGTAASCRRRKFIQKPGSGSRVPAAPQRSRRNSWNLLNNNTDPYMRAVIKANQNLRTYDKEKHIYYTFVRSNGGFKRAE